MRGHDPWRVFPAVREKVYLADCDNRYSDLYPCHVLLLARQILIIGTFQTLTITIENKMMKVAIDRRKYGRTVRVQQADYFPKAIRLTAITAMPEIRP